MSPLRALLALLWLLGLLQASRAHCGPVEEYQPRKDHQPTIVASTTFIGREQLCGIYLETVYGDQAIITCSSNNASSLIIQDKTRQFLQAKNLNSSSIQVIIEKLEVGGYIYICTDNYSGRNDSLMVSVFPAMSVTAPRLGYRNRPSIGLELYFVPYGELFHVFCSANMATSLIMELYYPSTTVDPISVQTINETTIALNRSVADVEEEIYICSKKGYVYLKKRARIIMDYYPEARMFRCILYFEEQTLECTWVSSSIKSAFRLYVLRRNDQESFLICRDKSNGLNRGCASRLDDELDFIAYNDFVLQLRACNKVICSNQNFSIRHASIIKLPPILDLQIISTSSEGVDLQWRIDGYEYENRVHRIEYRLLGTEWLSVNSSSVKRSWNDYKIHLNLPCPSAHYEVRVSARYEEATEDIYWSDPVSVFFFTARSTSEVDPACKKDFREVTEKAPPSAGVMVYEVRELISDERKKKVSMDKLVSRLNQKLAKIKARLNAKM